MSRKVTLKSSNGEEFVVEEAVARESQTILHVIEDVGTDKSIPLPNVNSKILAKVIEYCKKHVESVLEDESIEELKNWYADFVKVDQDTLFNLILAANYLNIKGLLDLTCQTVADMIKGKTPEEIRRTFNIKNDFTPEEGEEIRRENQWPFEDEEDEDQWPLEDEEDEDLWPLEDEEDEDLWPLEDEEDEDQWAFEDEDQWAFEDEEDEEEESRLLSHFFF
ncbi:hypothetical protein KFK09_018256 [Dendrobium nobile]|uniref:SKP1-like protein n=1 Tax=Dendrobium nobile TaxID=94219 RepID=A0A8T3AVH9_DENNO|nr:hypothetical protein KFK09_018256 [Dendrobium nobile]